MYRCNLYASPGFRVFSQTSCWSLQNGIFVLSTFFSAPLPRTLLFFFLHLTSVYSLQPPKAQNSIDITDGSNLDSCNISKSQFHFEMMKRVLWLSTEIVFSASTVSNIKHIVLFPLLLSIHLHFFFSTAHIKVDWLLFHQRSSGAVWESRWPSWAVCPNKPSGFHGHKATLNHASALVTACPWYVNWHLRMLRITSSFFSSNYLLSVTVLQHLRIKCTPDVLQQMWIKCVWEVSHVPLIVKKQIPMLCLLLFFFVCSVITSLLSLSQLWLLKSVFAHILSLMITWSHLHVGVSFDVLPLKFLNWSTVLVVLHAIREWRWHRYLIWMTVT